MLITHLSLFIFILYFNIQNEVESMRLHTTEYEMIIAQTGNFTVVATQSNIRVEASKETAAIAGGAEAEAKEGEGEKKAD